MLGFRDMTFCPFEDCSKFANNECGRALNMDVQRAADAWWNRTDKPTPIWQYTERPDCYLLIVKGKKYDRQSAEHNGLIGPGKQLREMLKDDTT